MTDAAFRAVEMSPRSGDPAAAAGLARWLCLAATPTFALMALLTALDPSPMERLCASAAGAPLRGMLPMYLLMSVFHAPPWLKLVFGPRRRQDRHA
jgi:hypothetical protein